MKETIRKILEESMERLGAKADFSVEHPEDLSHGDYSSNVALVLSKEMKMNPRELAEKIRESIKLSPDIEKIEVAGAGFINFYLSKDFFHQSVEGIDESFGRSDFYKKKKVMVEYTQPNPFKPFHIGHLMSNSIGESISRLVEFSGARIVRANYQGDVGLHVAKAIYGLLRKGRPAESTNVSDQAEYIGECYSYGSNFYDTDEKAKEEIDSINKKVYEKSDHEINSLYEWGRKVTLDAFEIIYAKLGTKFDHYYFESKMAPIGATMVEAHLGKVFEVSDGAIVFRGEKRDPKLHTRVFVTKSGLATYEAKEIGLTMTKFSEEDPDISITVTASEQEDYMKVVQKAVSEIEPSYASRMKHIAHGMMRLSSGKMSSRKGNVVTGESLLRDSLAAISEKIKDRDFPEEEKKEVAERVGVAALKYSILKQAMGGDIVYDFEKSISFEGDSGPYLQYSYARAMSVLGKAKEEKIEEKIEKCPDQISEPEKLLYRFPEIVERAAGSFEPHHIANYLIDLSRAFNTYYGHTKIVDKDDPFSPYKVMLTGAFARVMKNGLWLLGIKVPEKM